MRELLVVIDYQNDFVTGALGNPAAAALEPGIAARVAAQLERGGRVLFTRDTHGTDYLNTREGRFLPVAHCIKAVSYTHLPTIPRLKQSQKGQSPPLAEHADSDENLHFLQIFTFRWKT